MEPRRADPSAQENSLEKYRKKTITTNNISTRQTIRPHRCSGYHVEVQKTQIDPSPSLNKNEISLPLPYLSPHFSKNLQDSNELKDKLSPPPSFSEVSQLITSPQPKRDNFKINKFLLFKHRKRSITSSSQIAKESAATTIATIPAPSMHLNSTISNMKIDQEKTDFFLVTSNFPSLTQRQESREIQHPSLQSMQSPQKELSSEQNIQIKSKTDIMSTSIQLTHQQNQPISKTGLKNLISPLIQSQNKIIITSNTDQHNNNLKNNYLTSNSSNDIINTKGNFEQPRHQINRYLVPSSQKHLPYKESPNQSVSNHPQNIAQPLSHRKLNCPPKLFTTFHGGNSIQDLSVDRILCQDNSQQQDIKQTSQSKQGNFKINNNSNSNSKFQNQVTSLKLLPLDKDEQQQPNNQQKNVPSSFFHINRDTNTLIPRKGLQMAAAISQTEQCIPNPLSPVPSPLKTNRSMINIFKQQPQVARQDQTSQQLMTQSVQVEHQTQINKLKSKLATITQKTADQTQETSQPLQVQVQQQPENTEKPSQKPFDKLYTSFLAVQFKNQLMGKNKRSNQMFNRLSIESRIELSRLVQYLIYMQNEFENLKKVSQLIHQIVYHIPYLVNMLFKDDKTIILRDQLDLDYITGYLSNKEKMERYLPDKNILPKDINSANRQYEALLEEKILSDIAYLNEKLSLLVQKRFEDKFDHVSNAIIKEHYEIKLLEKHLQKRIADQSQTQPLPMNSQLKARHKYQGIDHYTFESKNPRFFTFSQRFGKQAQTLGEFTGIDQQTLTISSNLDQVYKKIQADSETKLELNQSQLQQQQQQVQPQQ